MGASYLRQCFSISLIARARFSSCHLRLYPTNYKGWRMLGAPAIAIATRRPAEQTEDTTQSEY